MAVTSKEPLRQIRERELVAATRALFDERGILDAPIDEIAKSVGIARGLVYRHFTSKDELYVATVCNYLAELSVVLHDSVDGGADPVDRLERVCRAYGAYLEHYPAFCDSALALMRRPAGDLQESISPVIWLRLGQGMTSCIDQLSVILAAGNESGDFEVEDPDFMANVLWTQGLGTMHLSRIGVGVRQPSPGLPGLFPLEASRVVETSVANAMAAVLAPPRG